MERDMSTRDLSVYLKVPVAEARRIKAIANPGKTLDRKVRELPFGEDSNAYYCRTRTSGMQYSFTFDNKKYCSLPKYCLCQRQNGKKAKLCHAKNT